MKLYGIAARFDQPKSLLNAVRSLREAGYSKLEAYTSFPVEGLSEALGMRSDRVALITLIGGAVSGTLGYFMQWYALAYDYPIIVANRPFHSWPAFIPVTFELTVLGAALSAAFGMLAMNGLPRLYHPLFEIDEFSRTTNDAFFVCVRESDPKFRSEDTRSILERLQANRVFDVPAAPDPREYLT